MKNLVLFFRCVGEKIKNLFFNSKNNSKSVACSQWQKYTEENASAEDKSSVEEYLKNYQVTTRWQTL